MTEPIVSILLKIVGAYLLVGSFVVVLFFTRWLKTLDPTAVGGSWGFRLLVTPGVVALWPVILMKVFYQKSISHADGARELRRNHLFAFIVLTISVTLIFTAALIWRAPKLTDLPEIESPTP